MGSELGDALKSARQMKGLSLKVIASDSEISAAYLQKLEAGEVKSPSPNILHALSGVLDLPYAALMELAGYVVPRESDVASAIAGSPFDHALNSADLSEEERRAVSAFIAHLRDLRD